MAMKYFHCYYDNEVAVDRLTDAQAGRLFKALLDYASRREEGPLGAREQGIFDLMSLQIGRDQEKYEERCLRNRENGRKGAMVTNSRRMAANIGQEEDKEEEENKNENKNKDENEDKDEHFYFSPEPSADASAQQVFTLPLNTGEDFPITSDMLCDWESLYPGVDVLQTLRHMRGWLEGNRNRRKTRKGILRFVHGWLARAQDNAIKPGYRVQSGGQQADNPFLEMLREAEGDHEPF